MSEYELFITAAIEQLDKATECLVNPTSTDADLDKKKWLCDYRVARAQVYATLAVATKPGVDNGVI